MAKLTPEVIANMSREEKEKTFNNLVTSQIGARQHQLSMTDKSVLLRACVAFDCTLTYLGSVINRHWKEEGITDDKWADRMYSAMNAARSSYKKDNVPQDQIDKTFPIVKKSNESGSGKRGRVKMDLADVLAQANNVLEIEI